MATVVTVACEGDGDVPVARKVIEHVGLAMGNSYPCAGKGNLDKSLKAYDNAAKHSPWLVLRDLDVDADCAPTLVAELLPSPSPGMCFRVAVRAAEAWLMADRESFAVFFGVPRTKVPRDPESLRDPKTEVMNLARRS